MHTEKISWRIRDAVGRRPSAACNKRNRRRLHAGYIVRKNSIELPLLQQNDRVFVNRESADVETLEDPEDYIESEEDDEENEDDEEDEDVSEDAENDESTLETLNRKSDPLPLRFKPGTPRRVIRQVIQRLPPGRTGGIVSRGWRGPKRRGRDKRRRRKLGHC